MLERVLCAPCVRPTAPCAAAEVAPSVASLHDDIKTKEEFKYSSELEDQAREWISKLLDEVGKVEFAL